MGINDRLKHLRTSRGLNQSEMAEILGISLSSYQKYEREKGCVTPSLDVLTRIADYYHVSVDYLLGRETGEPSPLDELAGQFNMSLLEKKIVENYLALPEKMRGDLMEFLARSVKEVQNQTESAGTTEGKTVFKIASSKDNHPGEVKTLTPEEVKRLDSATDVTTEDSDL